jgi:hypothetical protein
MEVPSKEEVLATWIPDIPKETRDIRKVDLAEVEGRGIRGDSGRDRHADSLNGTP